MKYLSLAIYSDFQCVGSSCPLTCCSGWDIVIDPKTDSYYGAVTGEFGERLQYNIRRNQEESKFILNEAGECPFLNCDRLCDIYIQLGEDHMCQTCQTYPRTNYLVGDIYFSIVSISCPEVARMILSQSDAMAVDFGEDEEGQEISINVKQFNDAIRVFICGVNILQDRTLSIQERLASVLLLVHEFNEMIGQDNYVNNLVGFFSNTSELKTFIRDALRIPDHDINKAKFIGHILSLGYQNQQLPELQEFIEPFADRAFNGEDWSAAFHIIDDASYAVEYEQILVYIFFRYFMSGYENNQIWKRFSFAILEIFEQYRYILTLYYMVYRKMPDQGYRILLVSHISRAIEHGNVNRDRTMTSADSNGMLELEYIMGLIC